MNILIINHYAGSPHYGMEFRPYYLAREWIRSGHNVGIVAGSYSHIRFRQPEGQSLATWAESIDQIAYRWYRTPTYKGNGIQRALSMCAFVCRLHRDARQLVEEYKPDIVIASSTYPMDIWPAQRIAKFAGAKLVYEVHDLWPLSPIELGGMPRWHPFILWAQMAEDYAYRHADRVVSLLPKASSYMRSRGMAAEKFVYVPNGISEEEWSDPAPLTDDIRSSLMAIRAKGLPIAAYVGTHGLANALDVLLDAAKLLQDQVEILLVGPGPERNRLSRRVQEEKLLNVTMFAPVAKPSIPTLLQYVDIAYIGLRPNSLFRFGVSPNKLMDYMMAGKPVVQSIHAGNDMVSEAGCGITVPPGDADAAASAILQLARLPGSDLRKIGENGREFLRRNQTYRVLAERFLDGVRGDRPNSSCLTL